MNMDERGQRVWELRVNLLLEVGSNLAQHVVFRPRCIYPTLAGTRAIRAVLEREGLGTDRILLDDHEQTELEKCKGNWRPAVSGLAGPADERPDLESAAALFEKHVLPMQRGHKTRCKHWTSWLGICTWAVSQGALGQILPMTEKAMHAFLWDALSFQCTLPVLKQFLAAIQARHTRFRLGSPIGGNGDWSRLLTAVGRFQGRQRRPLYPIHRDLVVKLLKVEPPRHAPCVGLGQGCSSCWAFMSVWRDCLGTALLTMGCNRPDEGAELQVCDFWPDDDVRAGYEQFRGGATLNTKVQKNDQLRRGCGKRFGRSADPALDVVDQILSFTSEGELRRDARCDKDKERAMHCPYCPPLLPLTRSDGRFELRRYPTSSQISSMIVRALRHIGADTSVFSGVCARRGGLSTAIEAGVEESILWMQSGHAQNLAARRYVQLGSPALLYATWAAFKL